MLMAERNEKVLEYITKRELCSIEELSKQFSISVVTVHRVLNEFEKKGYVEKVRGGVKLAVQSFGSDNTFDIRLNKHAREKEELAEKALEFVAPNSSIFIDASTTSVYFARKLMAKASGRITIVTNSPIIIFECRKREDINAISTGGELIPSIGALAGSIAINTIKQMQFSSVFFSVGGISVDRGMTTAQSTLAELIRAVCSQSDDRTLLADHAKFSKVAPIVIGDLSLVNRIITDKMLGEDVKAKLKKLDLEYID